MARLPNTATPAERMEVHVAKMSGKKYDAARRFASQPTPLQRQLARIPAGAFTRMANANRHTLDPHKHEREIARRERAAERINANRESRTDASSTQTCGYYLAGGIRFNRSRRGNLVQAA